MLLACFDGHKRAGAVHRPLGRQLKTEGGKILDEVLFTVTPNGKARVHDPRRTVAGTLTSALTWGLFGLVASGGSWASLVVWAVIGAACGGAYAYLTEHLLTKDELTRIGSRLSPDSSAILAYVHGVDAATVAAAMATYQSSPASVATIGADLSATVLSGTASPVTMPSAPPGSVPPSRDTLLNMLVFRYPGADAAGRVNADASAKHNKPAVQTELLIHADRAGRFHVASPSVGMRAMSKSDVISWGAFGVVFGAIVGFGGDGGLFGALEGGVVTGIGWALFGLVAGALYGLWAGRAVSARRLNALHPLLAPDTSMIVAWAEGAVTPETLAGWSVPGSEQLILRFNPVANGAVLEV